MPDDNLPFDRTRETALSRRTLGALSLGAGAAAAASAVAAGSVVETDVVIKTADGNCDAAFIFTLWATANGRAQSFSRMRSVCGRLFEIWAAVSRWRAIRSLFLTHSIARALRRC